MSSDVCEQRHQVADYFVVVGLGDSIRRYNAEAELAENGVDGGAISRVESSESTNSNELRQLELPSTLDPITDVAVVCLAAGETIPQDYSCVVSTPNGHCANFNHATPNSPKAVYLCFKRSRDKSPLTDVDIVYKGNVQYQYDILDRSISGKSNADLNHSSAGQPTNICLRWAAAHSGLHFYGMAITDLCIVNSSKGEQVPRGFTKIDRPIKAGLTGPSFCVAYKKSLVKPHAVSYQAGILSRFPPTDHQDFPLPESVPLFCLPLGASVESWSAETDHPLPTFSSFVLTGTSGDKVYGAAVSFYEDVTQHECTGQMKKALFDSEDTAPNAHIYCSKSICLLSHWPYFSAFKAFLSSLYRISISGETSIPLERYIGNFMTDVPFPSPKRPTVLLQLGNESIVLSQPVRTPLPLSGANHSILLHALSAENLLTVLCLIVLEHKIILHSVKPSLLTAFGEALCSILFPFQWQCPYIPLCPLALASFIHAPIPFLIGIDSRFFDLYDTPEDVCCINLDNNTIAHSPTSKLLPASLLPKKPAANLLKTLKALQVQIPLGVDLDSDLAVTVAPLRVNPDQEDTASAGVAVREAFLRFNAQIFSGYSKFLRPLIAAPSELSTDVSQRFDLKGFKNSRPHQEHAFFTNFFDTQMFIKFVEERSFVSSIDNALVFFDECTTMADNPEPLINISHERDANSMTVVVSPPDMANLPRKTFAYPSFSLDSSLFAARHGDDVQHAPAVPKEVSLALITCRRSRQEKSKSNRTAHRYIGDPRRWSKYLLGHTYAVWYSYLPAYVHTHTFKREAVQTAFKLLDKIHSSGTIAPDEVLYRVLMEVCGTHGYPALAVRVLMEMRRMNISPNAVTYARYNKVALESKWPVHTGYWQLLRNVMAATTQLRMRLRERRAIEQSSSALASADKGRITQVRKAMRRQSLGVALDNSSLNSFSGDGDNDSLASMSSGMPPTVSAAASETSFDDKSLMSRDDRPIIVYTAAQPTPSHHWSTDNIMLSTSSPSKAPASPKRGHRRVASATIVMNPDNPNPSPSATPSLTSMPPPLVMPRTSSNSSTVVTSNHREVDYHVCAAAITMASCTRCHHCDCLVFDEQIMAGWQVDDSDFNTRCPYCAKQFIAFLNITTEANSMFMGQVDIDEDTLSQRFSSLRPVVEAARASTSSSGGYWCMLSPVSVPYLSPLLLRKEIETLLDQDTTVLCKPVLVDQHPIIYWNLVWYFRRLNLPSFLSTLLLESEGPKAHNVQTGEVVVCTVWHKEDMVETPPALYKQWINRGSTPVASPLHSVSNTIATQLQSLTARLQCAEYGSCIAALLKERVSWKRSQSASSTVATGAAEFRGLYWDVLLLLVTVSAGTIDLVKFDREFSKALQKLPRDLSAEVRRDDHPVMGNALYFRRAFIALGMRSWT